MPLNSCVLRWFLMHLFIQHTVLIRMTIAFIPLNRQLSNILHDSHQKYSQWRSYFNDNDRLVELQQELRRTSSNATSTTPSLLLQQQGRREMISQAIFGSSSFTLSSLLLMKQQPCWASFDDGMQVTRAPTTTSNNYFLASQPPDSVNFPTGLLESRVLENVYSYPPYGMESIDIFYPTWFYGTWNVASTTTSIEAPLGRSVFGSNATYQSALSEIGTTLQYESRFIDVGASSSSSSSSDGGTTTPSTKMIIADRGYNVQSIATAALGRNSVVDIPFVSANKLTAILSPIGAPNPLRVDLFTVNRRQEYVDDSHFHCSEVVREIVSSVGNKDGNPNSRTSASSLSTILKEVETTTLYTLNIDTKDPEKVTIRGRQRSAKFLVPTQNDATSFRLYEMTRGKPVDVRFYDVTYTKKQTA